MEFLRQEGLATYGAIIGTIALFLPILRERPKVEVRFVTNRRVFVPGASPEAVRAVSPYSPDKDYCVITVVNRGKRPVRIVKAGWKMLDGKEEKWCIASDTFFSSSPRILTEESPTTDFSVEQDLIDLSGIIFVWAEDGIGRMFKHRIMPRRRIWSHRIRSLFTKQIF